MSDVAAPLDRADAGARVAAIVLNHNRPDDTIVCVRSVLALEGGCEVAVVDNGSTDDSVEAVRTAHPGVAILETGGNLGFGGGMNVGIAWALERNVDYVWLLNNDVIAEPPALLALLASAGRHPRIGIVGSVVVDMDDPMHVQTWGGGSVNLWSGGISRYGQPEEGPPDFIVGVSMFIRREVFEAVPGFWPCYRFYFEDIDFSCEARRRGWRLAVAPGSVIRHRIGGTIGADLVTRPPIADAFHAYGVGVFIVRQAGLRALVAVPVRLAGNGHPAACGDDSRTVSLWSSGHTSPDSCAPSGEPRRVRRGLTQSFDDVRSRLVGRCPLRRPWRQASSWPTWWR